MDMGGIYYEHQVYQFVCNYSREIKDFTKETREMSYQCLGQWTGDNGMLYLSLLDMQ